MGANEKHAATYHGAYTPNVDELRDAWVDNELDPLPRTQAIELVPKVQAAFDGWLETVRAEAKAEALREIAEELGGAADNFIARAETIDGLAVTRFNAYATAYRSIGRYLLARANQYKEEPANGR